MECISCFKAKAPLTCGLCQSSLCKSCAQFMEDEDFAFLPVKPEALSYDTYCPSCFDQHVDAELKIYKEQIAKAQSVPVFLKKQSKETRRIERLADPVSVKDCLDQNETLTRLAFLAIRGGYDALVDVQISSVKVRPGNYQTTIWQGEGVPVNLDESKLLKDRSLEQTPDRGI